LQSLELPSTLASTPFVLEYGEEKPAGVADGLDVAGSACD